MHSPSEISRIKMFYFFDKMLRNRVFVYLCLHMYEPDSQKLVKTSVLRSEDNLSFLSLHCSPKAVWMDGSLSNCRIVETIILRSVAFVRRLPERGLNARRHLL